MPGLKKEGVCMNQDIQMKQISELRLDPDNPRLPEGADTSTQAAILKLFYEDYVLDELAASYIANGFFPTEQLLVLSDGTVLEGNRRLAGLKFLLHDEDAIEAGLPEYETDEPFSDQRRESLYSVPVLVVEDRDDIWAYLGYRHISGPKEWSPAAKARYISKRIDEVAKENPYECFKIVGKEIGSNARGARNAYIQYAILATARDEHGLYKDATNILKNRFGVWSRLTNNNNIFEYINFSVKDRSYEAIQDALLDLNVANLESLIRDMIPQDGQPALLNDSRRASSYASIITNETALRVLRNTYDYEAASMIAQGSSVNSRLRKIYSMLDVVDADINGSMAVDQDTLDLLKTIQMRIVGLKATVEYSLTENATREER